MDTQQIVLTVLAFAVLLAIFFIKEAINKKKGESGEDMEKIRRVVAKLLPDSASYTVAYAYYQKKKYAGNRTTTYYYHYAIAFKPGALFVAPITYDDGELGYKSGAVLTKENLGQVKLDGAETVREGLFFLAPHLTNNHWIMENRIYITTIGNHWFYK